MSTPLGLICLQGPATRTITPIIESNLVDPGSGSVLRYELPTTSAVAIAKLTSAADGFICRLQPPDVLKLFGDGSYALGLQTQYASKFAPPEITRFRQRRPLAQQNGANHLLRRPMSWNAAGSSPPTPARQRCHYPAFSPGYLGRRISNSPFRTPTEHVPSPGG